MRPFREWRARMTFAHPTASDSAVSIAQLRHDLAVAESKAADAQQRIARLRRRRDKHKAQRGAMGEHVDALSRELEEAEKRLLHPSHRVALAQMWREREATERSGKSDECLQFDNKLTSYSFAQSHGVSIPRLFHRWDSIDDLDPEEIGGHPATLMLKSAHGTSAQGVASNQDAAQLRGIIEGWRPLLLPSGAAFKPRIGPPFFTEEHLLPWSGYSLVDVKVYAFYGHVPVVMLVTSEDYRDRASTSARFVGPSGDDLGPIATSSRHDRDIPTPRQLDVIVNHSRRLSRALKRPFVRLDFYEAGGRVILGEITPWPGQGRTFDARFDAALGESWDLARIQLRSDIVNGASPLIDWGAAPSQLQFEHAPPWSP